MGWNHQPVLLCVKFRFDDLHRSAPRFVIFVFATPKHQNWRLKCGYSTKIAVFFCFGGEHRIIPSPHIKQPPETMGLANYSRLQVLSLSPRRQRASAALGWQLERNGKKEGVLGWILQQFRSFFMIFQWLWGFGTKGFTICPWCVCFGRDFVPPVARRAREQSGKGGKCRESLVLQCLEFTRLKLKHKLCKQCTAMFRSVRTHRILDTKRSTRLTLWLFSIAMENGEGYRWFIMIYL